MKKILLCTLYFVLCTFAFAFADPSPVVQVISYKEPLGMYYSLQGWGSGSIIDAQGHILTNNHVVDNGFGDISDDFAICVTLNSSEPPKCHYTASVVSRDPDKDVALLRIDSRDIFGNPVDLSHFTTLPVDYSYTPNTGDTVMARGYPWVGANTITETQGIVSGTYSYNANTYIKTDTLIAGGNSGGPLLRNGSMIGINTFLMGGFFDPALGYSLSVREAKEFIDSSTKKTVTLQKTSEKFGSFLQTTNSFTQKKQLTDPLISIDFPVKYNITTYIPSSYIDGQISEESSTGVQSFSFLHFSTPSLKTPEEIRYFLSGQGFFPFGQDIKFTTVTIGGQAFYAVDTLGNTSGDKAKTQFVYFKIVDEKHLLLLSLLTPPSNETTYPTIKKNIDAFLDGIHFPASFVFPVDRTIDVRDASVSVRVRGDELVDFRAMFFPYSGVISQLMTTYDDLFVTRTYLGNLWSYAQLSIVPNSFYTQGTSMQELFDKLRENQYFIQNTVSQRIQYKGHEGFTICDTDTGSSLTDERNISHQIAVCEAIIFVGENNSHFISLAYLTEGQKRASIFDLMAKYLDTHLVVSDIGKTNFGIAKQELPYTDVATQSKEFREALSVLIKHGILTARPTFDGDHPLKWDEYTRLFVWFLYHKRITDHIVPDDPKSPTFAQILKKIPIDLKAYVDESQVNYFDLFFRMQLAGVTLPSYSVATLSRFESQKDSAFYDEWKKIDDFEYAYYKGQVMGPTGGGYFMNAGSYVPENTYSYNPLTGLESELFLKNESIKFGVPELTKEERDTIDAELACSQTASSFFTTKCYKIREKQAWLSLSYSVLTKGQAISDLFSRIDFALWDADLAKRKMVKIDNR